MKMRMRRSLKPKTLQQGDDFKIIIKNNFIRLSITEIVLLVISLIFVDVAFAIVPPTQSLSSGTPASIAVGDLDGDGDNDIATTSEYNNEVLIFLQNFDDRFPKTPNQILSTPIRAYTLTIGDLNGDGLNDIATRDWTNSDNPSNISIFLQKQDHSFSMTPDQTLFTGNGVSYSIAIGELDGDGDNDIVTTKWSIPPDNGSLFIFLQKPDGLFSTTPDQTLTTGSGPKTVSIGDLDGDGDNDLASADYYSDQVSIFLQKSSHIFSIMADQTLTTGNVPYCLVINDIDGDGNNDIVTTDSYDDQVSIFLQKQNHKFSRMADQTLTTMNYPHNMVIGDLDGDKLSDIVVGYNTIEQVSIFLQKPDHTFSGTPDQKLIIKGAFNTALAIGDLDGDSDYDLAIGGNGQLLIFLQIDSEQLTTHEGNDLYPVWSPDGKKIAFCSERSGNMNIRIMNSDGTNIVQLTEAMDASPTWSPDGTKIAFSRELKSQFKYVRSDPEIWVMDSDGSNKIQLTTNGGLCPSWSPDGTKITFCGSSSKNKGIWVMNDDGSNKIQLTTQIDFFPAWNPDGTKIAFCSRLNSSNASEIWVMDGDGSNKIQLTTNGGACPTWSSDGTKIAFSRESKSPRGNPDIWVMDSDGSNKKPLTTNATGGYFLSWSPDGTKIAFTGSRSGNMDIWVLSVRGYKPHTSISTPTPVPTPEERGVPGFEAMFAIAGLLAVAYLLKRRN